MVVTAAPLKFLLVASTRVITLSTQLLLKTIVATESPFLSDKMMKQPQRILIKYLRNLSKQVVAYYYVTFLKIRK